MTERATAFGVLTSATPFSLKDAWEISFIFRIVTRFARCRRNRVDFLHDARLESIDDESG